MNSSICAARATAQGLTAPNAAASLVDIVEKHGWLRTLGGAEPYLAFAARRPGTTPEQVHAAVLAGDLAVTPAVRGCMYLVSRAHVPLALRLARQLDRSTLIRNLGKAGSSPEEVEAVGAAIVEILQTPLETREVAANLPQGVNRALGDAGKKVGLSSLVPPALRFLEWAGRVGRIPLGGRLDHERYTWVRTQRDLGDDPFEGDVHAIADLYRRWAGYGTATGLAGWSGLTKKLLAGVWSDDPTPADSRPEGRVVAIGGLDNLVGLHENAAFHVPETVADRPAEVFGFGSGTLARANQLFERLVTEDGRIVGVWAWDPDLSRVIGVPFASTAGFDEALAEAQKVLAALGHGRAMSLDNPASLRRRLALVRGST